MLKISTSDVINAPVDEVFRIARDQLMDLVPYFPNISRIEVKEKTSPKEGTLNFVNHWHAKVDVPSVAKKFITPELLSWKDIASWDEPSKVVTYRLESFIANDLFKSQGRNTFVAEGSGKTRLTVSCEVEIYPEKVPGVPRLLASTVKPAIEEIIRKMLEPNLTSLAKGLNAHFAKQSK